MFSGGMFPCDDYGKVFDFLINNGSRNFSPGDLLNYVTYLGSKQYFTINISTSDLYDVDEDGKIDLLLHGRGSEDNSASLPWFTQDQIDNMPFIASSGKIMFANSQGKYTLSDMKYIPHIPGYNKGLDFNIYDLDGDGKKEIIILLTGDGSDGEWSNSGVDNDNQNTTNYYQGYHIQICQLDENRNIVDVTRQFMDGNGQKGVGLGCNNLNFMFLQIGDYDDNGSLDIRDLKKLITSKTKFIAVTHCSNIVGEINDIKKIAEITHNAGALMIVDGVSFCPHGLPDVNELGADIYFFSAYKTYGPHQGIMVIRQNAKKALTNQSHFFNSDYSDKFMVPAGPDHAQVAACNGIIDYFDDIYDHHFSKIDNDQQL